MRASFMPSSPRKVQWAAPPADAEHPLRSIARYAAILRFPSISALARRPGILLAALAFVLYLPPALGTLQLEWTSVDYIDIGRRFESGQGFLLGVRQPHLGDTTVLHEGLSERALLYPLLVAAVFRMGFDSFAL